MARLVDGTESSRLAVDKSLLTTPVDRWRPETHIFHLPCGEMAPTLQDVSFLLGLPLVGEAVGPHVVRPTWMAELEARFAGVDWIADFGPIIAHPTSVRGSSKRWLLQFQVCLFASMSIAFELYYRF